VKRGVRIGAFATVLALAGASSTQAAQETLRRGEATRADGLFLDALTTYPRLAYGLVP